MHTVGNIKMNTATRRRRVMGLTTNVDATTLEESARTDDSLDLKIENSKVKMDDRVIGQNNSGISGCLRHNGKDPSLATPSSETKPHEHSAFEDFTSNWSFINELIHERFQDGRPPQSY